MSTVTRRSLAGIVGLAVGIAGLAFVGIRIARDWDQIVETMRSANPAWLFAAVVAGLVSMTLIAVNWLSLIERRAALTPIRTPARTLPPGPPRTTMALLIVLVFD